MPFRSDFVFVQKATFIGLIKHSDIFLNVFVKNSIARNFFIGINKLIHFGLGFGVHRLVGFLDIFQIFIVGDSELVLELDDLLGLFEQLVAAEVGRDLFEVDRTDTLNAVQRGLDLACFGADFGLKLGFFGFEGLYLVGKVGQLFVSGEGCELSHTLVFSQFDSRKVRQFFFRLRLLPGPKTLSFFLNRFLAMFQLSIIFFLTDKPRLLILIILLFSQHNQRPDNLSHILVVGFDEFKENLFVLGFLFFCFKEH